MNLQDQRFLRRLGAAIRERRLALGISQLELARRTDVHRTFVGSCERGERNLAMLSLRRIAAGLRVTVTELVQAAEARGEG